jgi:hypothetical protein
MAEPVDIRSIIADNLTALMLARWDEANTNRLARDSTLGTATVQRIRDQTADYRIDAIPKLAAALHIDPWQLLVPDINPENMPRLDSRLMSAQASDLAAHLDRITDPAIRQRAYATALAVISLATDWSGTAPPSPPAP